MLKEMDAKPGEKVLDPFAGASTTLIEARNAGLAAYGYEINPFLHFVGRTSLNWEIAPSDLLQTLEKLNASFHDLESRYGANQTIDLPFEPPAIYNVHRWWRDDVLVRLILLREAIQLCCKSVYVADFFRLCLAGVLVPDLTNVTLGRLQLHFIDRNDDEINVWTTFAKHAEAMIEDMRELQLLRSTPGSVLLNGDSVSFEPKLPTDRVDIVITSPPYPNRYSYVWNTRPHLYMLGFFKGKREAGELDSKTIGGTWGTATSSLAKGEIQPYNAAVEKVVGQTVNDIRKHDVLMSNYCMNYFNRLAEHLENLVPYLAKNARLGYVVGCSRLRGVYVETDTLLSKLIAETSPEFHSHSIHRFRKRNSGKDLHESAVYAIFK
jgi:hypothetical protein